MTAPRRMILALMNRINVILVLPVVRWCAAGHAMPKSGAWVEPSAELNRLVFAAALQDRLAALESQPQKEQAELNACMASLRDSEVMKGMLGLFGSLTASGYPIEESFLRVISNAVHFGIYVNRRLSKESTCG